MTLSIQKTEEIERNIKAKINRLLADIHYDITDIIVYPGASWREIKNVIKKLDELKSFMQKLVTTEHGVIS